MKKIAVIVAISFLLVMSFPIISFADNTDSLQIITQSSVDGFYSDSDLEIAQKFITSYVPLNNNIYPDMATLYGYLNSYSFDSTYDYFVVFVSRYSDTLMVYEFNSSDIGIPFIVVNDSTLPSSNTPNSNYTFLLFLNKTSASWYTGRMGSLSLNAASPTWNINASGVFTGNGNSGIAIISNTQEQLLCGNIPCYMNWDIINNGGSAVSTSSADFYSADKSSYTNFLSSNIPYTDSDGNIVTPGPVEPVIDKSIAFRKIDLSTIYSYTAKAHCAGLLAWEIDPVGYSIIDENLAGWTMHYNVLVTFKWDTAMDNWVYQPFYSGGSAAGTVVWDIEIEPTGSIKANEQTFDIYDLLNNYQVTQGSSTDVANLALAVYALKSGKGSVWGDVFGQSGSDISNIASEISSKNLFSINGYSSSQIDSIFNPTYSYALTHLDMQVVAYPVNNTAHIKGKSGTTKLNLVTNTNSSYAQGAEVTDSESGYDIVSPDYESSGDTVVTPVNNGSGSQVYVVINNPLSGNNGGGSSSSSSSSPSINVDVGGGTYAFDPGYEDLKNDIIAQDNNWATYFDPFVDDENGAGELTGTVLTYLPSEMKTIFISGFGVLTLLAIYRYIRRG